MNSVWYPRLHLWLQTTLRWRLSASLSFCNTKLNLKKKKKICSQDRNFILWEHSVIIKLAWDNTSGNEHPQTKRCHWVSVSLWPFHKTRRRPLVVNTERCKLPLGKENNVDLTALILHNSFKAILALHRAYNTCWFELSTVSDNDASMCASALQTEAKTRKLPRWRILNSNTALWSLLETCLTR